MQMTDVLTRSYFGRYSLDHPRFLTINVLGGLATVDPCMDLMVYMYILRSTYVYKIVYVLGNFDPVGRWGSGSRTCCDTLPFSPSAL